MRLIAHRPEVQWKPLTAIVRRLQDQHPEWVGTDIVDAIKTELVRQGFQDPPTERVYQALDAVDRARARSTPSPSPSPPAPPVRPLSREESRELLAVLRQHFGSARPKTIPGG